jgi:DNA repair exonuclease SbcCD nuclease subunit
MTIAHLSDTHLGYRRFLKTTDSGFNLREADVLRSFESALAAIVERDPDLIIHAGDLFHQVRPSNATIVRTYTILSKYQALRKNKPLLIIGGNHDTPRTSDVGNILKLFAEIPGVQLRTDALEFVDYPNLKAEVLCVPHQALRLNPKEVYSPSGKRKYKFMTLHGLLVDAQRYQHHDENALTLDQLQQDRWDYVALGDFHGFASYGPNIAYSGSTDFTSSDIWSEVGPATTPKSWLWFDTDAGRIERLPIEHIRPVLDLPPIDAEDLDERELLQALFANFTWDKNQQPIVRQLVTHCRPEVRAKLRTNQLRELQQASLNYLLDARITVGLADSGASTSGTLEQDWVNHVRSTKLPQGLDPAELERVGIDLLQEVRIDATATA